ncbi:hypothetical protein DUGA6_63710 [Duganella sp. HH105]|nr:hypothetical protein DUGA6_63710 [Duganella sp. HH105]
MPASGAMQRIRGSARVQAAIISTALGRNMPALAAMAPASPATLRPTKAELIITGPGLSWVSARASTNWRGASQP